MHATIRDVARRAGVSVSTASLALNNKPHVSPETRARVLKAAQELNYHLHHTAKSLAAGQTYQLGVFNPVHIEHIFSSGFFTQLIRGIYKACHAHGYFLSLYIADDEEDTTALIERCVYSHSVDGLLITHPTVQAPYLQVLLESMTPFVFIGRPPKQLQTVSYVDNDNVMVSHQAIQHLVHLGHHRILLLNAPSRYTFSLDRLTGYREALARFGLPFDESLVYEAEMTRESAYQVTCNALKRCDFSAIFTMNDLQAVGAIQALEEHGLSVPQDVAVVTANDTDLARYFTPPLTSIDLRAYELGYQAIHLLQRQIEKGYVTHTLVPTELIVRTSSGAPKN